MIGKAFYLRSNSRLVVVKSIFETQVGLKCVVSVGKPYYYADQESLMIVDISQLTKRKVPAFLSYTLTEDADGVLCLSVSERPNHTPLNPQNTQRERVIKL